MLVFMEETGEQLPKTPKKIRVTRTEAYAMRISKPRKKKLAFGLIALLIAVVLGNVLWHFQDAWLPYWFPATPESAAPITMPAVDELPAVPPAAPVAGAIASTPEPVLDYLSAAVWDQPQFLQGVRTFNQALDRYRLFLRDRTQALLPAQVEEGAFQAAQIFAALRADAPAAVPLNDYLARCRRLIMEVRQQVRATSAPAAKSDAPASVPATIPTDYHHLPDYLEGARLFNEALAQFDQYKANPARTELLEPTEELARQAAQKFEALKRGLPEQVHAEIDRLIHPCYGIVSACRGAQLQKESSSPANSFDRRTVGPSRRPALPAYQPVQ